MAARKPIPSWGRLSCLLAWALAAPALGADPTPDAWTVQAAADGRQFAARLDRDGHGLLLVECDEQAVLFDVGEPFRVDGWGETPPLRFWYDDGDVQRVEVHLNRDLPPTMAVLGEFTFGNQLIGHAPAVLYVSSPSDPRGAPHAFALDGLGEAIDSCDPTPIEDQVVVFPVDAEGYVPFHPSEVRLRKGAPLQYPDGGTLPGTVRCVIRVYIDEKGWPTKLNTGDCPEPYVGAAQAYLMNSRWRPARIDGKAMKATFRVNVDFRR